MNYAKNSIRSGRFALDLLFIRFHFIANILVYVPSPWAPCLWVHIAIDPQEKHKHSD